MALFTAKNSASPKQSTSPMRQSNMSIITVMTAVVTIPEQTIITTLVATFSRLCIVFVATDIILPRLFAL